MPQQCQLIGAVAKVGEGRAKMPPQGFVGSLRLVLERALSPQQKQRIKQRLAPLMHGRVAVLTGSPGLAAQAAREAQPTPVDMPHRAAPSVGAGSAESFAPGDVVRVRSREAIAETLDNWGQLRGCAFMPEMWQYCDTTQRVLKPVRRFVDERDRRVRKASGLYLLDGVICEGTDWFGRCDRACLYFWRREWLERVAPDA